MALSVGCLLAVGAVAGCGFGDKTLTVFGAASLKAALERIETDYEAAHYGILLNVSTGSSSALRTQIEQGAPADLFLSADTENVQALTDADLTITTDLFTSNRLAIIVPRGNPAGVNSLADLARPGVRVVAAGNDVPITDYAEQSLLQLAAMEDPVDFAMFDDYRSNIVSREESVGAIVTKVALGEGDAAIVYATDPRGVTVDVVEISDELNVAANYAGAVLKRSPNAIAARELFDWIRSPDGQEILIELGFSPTR